MDRRKVIAGFILFLAATFLIVQNQGSIETGCWDRMGCNYYGRGFTWEYSRGFGPLAWAGTFLNGVASVVFSWGVLSEKAGLPLRVVFAVLLFCFAMVCSIMTVIN